MSDAYDILSLICEEVSTVVLTSRSPHFTPMVQDHVDRTKKNIQEYYLNHPFDSPKEQLLHLEKLLEDTYSFAKNLTGRAHLFPTPALWAVGSILITSALIAKKFFKNEVLQCRLKRLEVFEHKLANLKVLDLFIVKLQELYQLTEFTKLGIELMPITFCNCVLKYFTDPQCMETELEHRIKADHLDGVPSDKLLVIITTVKLQLMSLGK